MKDRNAVKKTHIQMPKCIMGRFSSRDESII